MAGIDLESPFEFIRGGYKGSGFFFKVINGRVVACGYGKYKDRKTEEQLRVRKNTKSVVNAWRLLTETQRNAWRDYARAFLPKVVNGRYITRRGYDVYKQANFHLASLGLPPRNDAPVQSPPPPPTGIELNPYTSDTDISFRLIHPYALPEGFLVVVRMTRAMEHDSIQPEPGQLRMIKGLGLSSAVPLPPSGDTIEFTNCRFPIKPGDRFLLSARIVRTDDGLASDEFYVDVIREG